MLAAVFWSSKMYIWAMEVDFVRWIEYLPYAQCFFIVGFDKIEDKKAICEFEPWFWGGVGLFMNPWTPTFDLIMASISMALVWVRLLKLPLHFWNIPSLLSIGDVLGNFYCCCPNVDKFYKTTYAWICVDLECNKSFPMEINLMTPTYVLVQNIDYENVSFRCGACYEMGHVIKNFPKCIQNRKYKKKYWRPKWVINIWYKKRKIFRVRKNQKKRRKQT